MPQLSKNDTVMSAWLSSSHWMSSLAAGSGAPEPAAKLDIQWELDSQADITVSFLESCGIPAFQNGSLGKVLGGFASQGVEIWVPASRLEEAQALLDAPTEETSPEQD